MAKKRIFISCGQRILAEKIIGQEIKEIIAKNDMEGFFAEEAHDASDLNLGLFRELQSCDGMVAVMHNRGEVKVPGVDLISRGSVWIQQEIAILFYRSFLIQQIIPMRIYIENGVSHEGLTLYSLINPISFKDKSALLENLSNWLSGPAFYEAPVLARRENLFKRRTEKYGDHHWLLLEVIAAHSTEQGDTPHAPIVKNDFEAILVGEGMGIKDAQHNYQVASRQFHRDGLIHDWQDQVSRIQYTRIQPQWWDLIIEELRNRARLK